MTAPVVVFRTRSDVEARVVRGLLEAHGIATALGGDTPLSAFPMVVNTLGETEIAVHPDDAARARGLIDSHRVEATTAEGGVVIDARGTLDGIAFNDVGGIGPAMHDNPAAPACLVDRLYAYAIARPTQRNERKYLKYLERQFERDQYRVPDLLHRIAISDALYAVRPPVETTPALARSTP